MKNLGKASVRVKLYSALPNIDPDPQFHDFDVSAHMWELMINSQFFSPLLTEYVTDELSAVSVCFPSKRKAFINNYVMYSDGSTLADTNSNLPSVIWTPISETIGVMKDIVKEEKFYEYTLQQPSNYTNTYTGPKWEDSVLNEDPPPDDAAVLTRWSKWYQESGAEAEADVDAETDETTTAATTLPQLPKINYVNQVKVQDGLWWGIESSDFLYTNMPFWVTIKRSEAPSSNSKSTVIIICMGLNSDSDDCYDIYLSNNKRPYIIDYYQGRDKVADTDEVSSGGIPAIIKEFPLDFSKLFTTDKEIEIGVMTIGGRLVLFVNKTIMVYTRVDKGQVNNGKIREAKIDPGKIRIYGTNTQVNINVSPMTFAEKSIIALPVPAIPVTTDESTGESVAPKYREVKYNGDIGSGSVARIPTPPSEEQQVYGVDCENFYSDSGGDSPEGFGFHKNGRITFTPAKYLNLNIPDSAFYVLLMQPSDVPVTINGESYILKNGGCPYFFRLKGGYRSITPAAQEGVDVSKDVFTVGENIQAPDYFSVKSSSNVTLYNKAGTYDYLKFKQYGITIEWGWNDIYTKTFTGVITGATTGETPGKETIDLKCEDYSYILSKLPIVNSPFYDGMVMFYAVRDIVRRSGVYSVINDWELANEYFLPSGYAFTKPAMKFPSETTLFDCVMSIVKRAEAFIYFDQEGHCHVKKLPGGLFSVGASESIVSSFSRNPEAEHVILGEKNLEYTTTETFNRLTILTLDRDTRNIIVYTKSAGLDNAIIHKRPLLQESAIYGEYDVAVAYAHLLSQRIFKPIRRISFRTVGDSEIIRPLSFIQVDGLEFRLLSLNRKYNSESNDFTNEYNAEWFGG